MEKFQGPTNQCFFGENLDVEGPLGLEQGQGGFVFSYGAASFLNTTESFRFQEDDQQQHLQHHQQEEQEEKPLQQSLSLSIPIGLEDKMPFLEMLQSVESPPYSPFAEPPPPPQGQFRVLLALQQQQQQRKSCEAERNYLSCESTMDYSMRMQASAMELESCITTTTHNDMASESHSPVKSDTNKEQEEQACPSNYLFSSHPVEVVSSSAFSNGELGELPSSSPEENYKMGVSSPTTNCWVESSGGKPKTTTKTTKSSKPAPSTRALTTSTSQGRERERKKRKRTRPNKNREEVESQRMTHIAVERNRRRQMNDHLNALRSLMPPSFVQRGDQASIIGGAIDFVKELEQLLQSLEAKKRTRSLLSSSSSLSDVEEAGKEVHNKKNKRTRRRNSCTGDNSDDNSLLIPFHRFFSSPQYTSYSSSLFCSNKDHDEENNEDINNNNYNGSSRTIMGEEEEPEEEEELRMNRLQQLQEEDDQVVMMNKCVEAAVADIEVIVVQTHVNLKILSPRRPGQLLRAIAALEDLRLTILHLNVTSFQLSVLYSFNLKIEDDCRLGSNSADEIATAVHQIFSYINGGGGEGN